jgi:uncharacterized membrane protein
MIFSLLLLLIFIALALLLHPIEDILTTDELLLLVLLLLLIRLKHRCVRGELLLLLLGGVLFEGLVVWRRETRRLEGRRMGAP